MMHAEDDKLLIRDYRVFWIGHVGDIEHVYTRNKGLDEQTLDKAHLTTRQS